MNNQEQNAVTFSVFVYDTISLSVNVVNRVTALLVIDTGSSLDTVVSVEEYRQLMGDVLTSDEQIAQRLRYIENLSRGIIRSEVNAYGNGSAK
jgi:hypothetical protein